MSKSLNILLPALGGTAIVLALAITMANRNYGGSKIEMLEDRLSTVETRAETADAKAKEQSVRADELAQKVQDVQAKAELVAAGATLAEPAPRNDDIYGLGRTALDAEIIAWDVDVLPGGRGLPEGRGDATWGEEVFVERCAACHGDFAEGVDNWPVLAGGFDTLGDKDPVKTVGSYWPHLSTAWDYINRSMPFGEAGTLTPDETYAIVAYILYSNDLVDDDFELSHENFAAYEMYNKNGFILDDRADTEYPLWRTEPCMENCKSDVKITMRASVVDVTPDEEGSASSAMMTEDHSSAVTTTPEVTPTFDAALVAAGEKVFKKCAACHQIGEGAKNRSGPQLNAIVGRTMGSAEGFKYSRVLKEALEEGRVWDAEALAAFLEKPKSYLKGTKMAFAGLKSGQDIAAIVEYLKLVDE